jgi:hypothetical protein
MGFAQRRVASGRKDRSAVLDDAPGYTYRATTDMCKSDPAWMISGGSIVYPPPPPLGGMPPARIGGNIIPPLPAFNTYKNVHPSLSMSGMV